MWSTLYQSAERIPFYPPKNAGVSDPQLKERSQHCYHPEGVQRGILAMSYKPTIRLQPALNIDADTIDAGAEILEELLSDMDQKKDWK